jgi:hypothetical protein
MVLLRLRETSPRTVRYGNSRPRLQVQRAVQDKGLVSAMAQFNELLVGLRERDKIKL